MGSRIDLSSSKVALTLLDKDRNGFLDINDRATTAEEVQSVNDALNVMAEEEDDVDPVLATLTNECGTTGLKSKELRDYLSQTLISGDSFQQSCGPAPMVLTPAASAGGAAEGGGASTPATAPPTHAAPTAAVPTPEATAPVVPTQAAPTQAAPTPERELPTAAEPTVAETPYPTEEAPVTLAPPEAPEPTSAPDSLQTEAESTLFQTFLSTPA